MARVNRQVENRRAYQKEYKRIMNFMRRARARGYHFKPSDAPKKVTELKRVTAQSIRKLKSITPEKLYKKAKYESTTGKIISGSEGRKEERRLAGKRAAETRRQNRWNRERREQDEIDAENARNEWRDNGKDSPLYIGNVALDRIRQNINDARNDFPKTCEYLERILNEEIAEYGKESVIAGLANAPTEAIEAAEIVIVYPLNSPQSESALTALLEIIRAGEIPAADELKRLGDLFEMDAFEEYSE